MPQPGELDVAVETGGDGTILRVAGDIDIATVEQLERSLNEALEGGTRALVLDLAGVAFLDSTGMGVIVNVERRLQRDGGTLVLRNLQALPYRVLEISGLAAVLTIER